MGEVIEEPSKPQSILINSVCNRGSSNNSKEKTPMCLVNELARYNQIPHQYRLTHEDGPAHKKVFTVTLKLGDEEYQADGSSIKKAQHCAAQLALTSTVYKHPPEKCTKPITSRRNITPTVELNALAMKRGEVTEYSFLEQPAYAPEGYHHGRFRGRGMRGYRSGYRRGYPHPRGPNFIGYPMISTLPYPEGTYKVLLKVNEREYTGCGLSPQAARHDAASQALTHMRELMAQEDSQEGDDDECADCSGDRKSPVSLVHEMALKRKLSVSFEVVEEKGQPHMRMYYTKCTVGSMVTMGEGNGKKISKGKAAELMLVELSKLPELTEAPKSKFKKRMMPNNALRGGKRKTSRTGQVIEEGQNPLAERFKKEEHCYIEELLSYQTSQGGPEPTYILVDTKTMPNSKRKEFTMQVTLGDRTTLAISSSKKGAMRNAAHMMLIELGACQPKPPPKKKAPKKLPVNKQRAKLEVKTNGDGAALPSSEDVQGVNVPNGSIVKEECADSNGVPTAGAGGRQLVPGMILVSNASSPAPKLPVDLNKSARIAQEYLSTGTSPTAEALTKRRKNRKQQAPSHPIEQLAFLAQLTGFSVQYSDFPNPNGQTTPGGPSQGFLSLVQLSTAPPQVCTGVGASIEESQKEAAISALKFISDMGLESIASLRPEPAPSPQNQNSHKNSGGALPKTPNNNRSPSVKTSKPTQPPVTPMNSPLAYNNHTPSPSSKQVNSTPKQG